MRKKVRWNVGTISCTSYVFENLYVIYVSYGKMRRIFYLMICADGDDDDDEVNSVFYHANDVAQVNDPKLMEPLVP